VCFVCIAVLADSILILKFMFVVLVYSQAHLAHEICLHECNDVMIDLFFIALHRQ